MRTGKLIAVLLLAWSVSVCEAQTSRDAARLAGNEPWKTDFSKHAVPLEEIVSGGPPRDGIPPIDRPRFESVRAANRWLKERDPVMVVEHGSQVKAYPLAILIWHEIVNDVVGGLPVAVTFCPLCNTALVFDRRLEGRLLDFGTTGRLRHSDLVMYDRQTESWWQQATGEAIVGALTGTRLRFVPQTTLAWRTARDTYPNLQVLSRETGHDRDYGRNPYVGYDDRRNSPIASFFRRDSDPRLPAMERVVALELGKGWAVAFETMREQRVVNAVVERTPLAVFWQPGAASALDQGEISRGRDVGQTAVFDRRLEGRTLTFRAAGGGFQDAETGSRWDLAGRAVAGPLRGKRLEAIPHGNHFWFAWIVFRPDSQLWTP
ncbi:DUF3179 domain-containing protein [soil metagenome]